MTAESSTSLAAVTDRRYSKKLERTLAIIFSDRVPVYDIPPRFDVIGPAVLIIQVIGVFPNVEAEKWCISVHERTVLVRGGYDLKFSTFVFNQPRPTAAEATYPSGSELFLKCIETSER